MTTLITKVKQHLDSGNLDGGREEIASAIANLEAIDTNILDFAALLALGGRQSLEIGLGVLGRELLDDELKVKSEILWLLLAAVLSRTDIPPDSPARISLLGLTCRVEDWTLPTFALLCPTLDSFFKVSLFKGNPLIAEQTLDFIANGEESYAKAPRTKQQLSEIKSGTQWVLKQVDDLLLKTEWQEGAALFFELAQKSKYSNKNIWYDSGSLIDQIYSTKAVETNQEYARTKFQILRLITLSFASLGLLFKSEGLSIAIHIDSLEKNKTSWAINASAVDRLERFIQEVADLIFDRLVKLPEFQPIQAVPGSFSMIFNIDINPNRATELAQAISSLSNNQGDEFKSKYDSLLLESWKNCVATLQEENLQVELAAATNTANFDAISIISTRDEYISCVEKYIHQNIRVLSHDVPQANNLERAIDFASLLLQFPSSRSRVKQSFIQLEGISDRQFSYYRRAAEILGLADERIQPTTACLMLVRLSKPEQRMRFLAHQFISSKVGSAWFNWLNVNDLADIQPDTATEFLRTVCPSLSEETVK